MDFTPVKDLMKRLTDWVIPGNAVQVYRDGKKVFEYQTGYCDLENQIPMQGNELLNIYSCSKVATVTAALQLYERGFFLLDDPLYEYIPEFRHMTVRLKDGTIRAARRAITMRQLFTMTAGFTYNLNSPGIAAARQRTNGVAGTLDVIRGLAEDPLAFDPGDKWNYSLCHDVLAAAVEAISGERFCDYMARHLFQPLGMDNTTYHLPAGEPDPRAQQYRYTTDEQDLVKLQRSSEQGGAVVNAGKGNGFVLGEGYDSGGAGVITTVGDYVKLAAALANGGTGVNGEQILAKGTVELLRSNQLTPEQAVYYNWPALRGYGYGLGVRTLTDRARAGFNGLGSEMGWNGAAGASVIIDPVENVALFYAHHMLNPQEDYYMPRLRNALCASL